jgi:CDP-diacylglycerol--serine O-phosphatidyltransferase
MGFVWLMDHYGHGGRAAGPWLAWSTFAVTLYAGLTMVTNVPFYSFKDLSPKRSVPFIVIVLIALGIAVVNIDPPSVLLALFVAYGLSGYAVYAWRKAKGRPVSVIAVSTEEPDERGLHR